jgi:hypothetical protein
MKKIIISILAFLYISTSAGATIHLIIAWGSLSTGTCVINADRCSKCGMKTNHKSENSGCCKDEYKEIKTEKDQKLSQTSFCFDYPTGIAIPLLQANRPLYFLVFLKQTRFQMLHPEAG